MVSSGGHGLPASRSPQWLSLVCLGLLGMSPAAVCGAVADAPTRAAEIVIYGGTSGGIVAAIQAAKLGRRVILIEPGRHLGGLTAGGLGATDIGNKAAIGGLSREFYARTGDHYAREAAWIYERRDDYRSRRKADNEREMWTFEPHVAEKVYREWLVEHDIEVIVGERLDRSPQGLTRRGVRIVAIRMESGRRFTGRVFIDATYEGDLMAAAGVSYHVGREANSVYGETLNGIQVAHATKHQFTHDVDPYVRPGDPQSGLLPLVSPDPPGVDGAGDDRVQAYNFRMCTTDVPENRLPWPKPAGYDPGRYELLLRNCEAGDHRIPWNPVWMPNRKTDTNNNFAISTDYIGGNAGYADGDYATRDRITAEHRDYQQGLMYTLANHPRVPGEIREHFQRLGLARDEFTDNDHWPHQLYVREARRMVSDYVMNQNHCQQRIVPEDPVGLGAYNMDSHNCQRYVTPEGTVRNEGDIQVGVSPYRISYRSIRPRQEECDNLLVPVCLSASHIAYGSIRMEPVFMVLGQSAATAASLAIEGDLTVQEVDYALLREHLLDQGQILEWTGPAKGSVVGIDPQSLPGIVVDNPAAEIEGPWESSRAIGGYVGADYLHDGDTAKEGKVARFTPTLPREATYEVRLYFPANGNRAEDVPVTIQTPSGSTERRISQRQATAERYVSLGSFRCPAGRRSSVTIRAAGTQGHVIADAVTFVEQVAAD